MKKIILAVALSAFAFPVAVADARPGNGHGPEHRDGDRHGAPQTVANTDGTETATDTPAEQPAETQQPAEGRRHASRRCKRTQSVGFVAKGTLTSFTAETVTLDVLRANRHARSFIASAGSEFTLGTARVRFEGVTDGNGDSVVDFADVLATDKVVAIGKAVRPKRGCEGETVLKLRKLQVVRPEADEADETEVSEQS